MSQLIMRAEQGVLGVMLTGGDQPPIRDHLTSSDFGHPVHAAVYSALRDLDGADLPPERLRAVVASTLELPEVTEQWLAELAERAPDTTGRRPTPRSSSMRHHPRNRGLGRAVPRRGRLDDRPG